VCGHHKQEGKKKEKGREERETLNPAVLLLSDALRAPATAWAPKRKKRGEREDEPRLDPVYSHYFPEMDCFAVVAERRGKKKKRNPKKGKKKKKKKKLERRAIVLVRIRVRLVAGRRIRQRHKVKSRERGGRGDRQPLSAPSPIGSRGGEG